MGGALLAAHPTASVLSRASPAAPWASVNRIELSSGIIGFPLSAAAACWYLLNGQHARSGSARWLAPCSWGECGMTATTDTGGAPDGDQPRTRWQKTGRWLQQNAGNVVLPALTVLVTAVAGTFAALYAHGQIAAADEQKVAAQQQELLTLVVDIEQEPAAEERATAPLHGTRLLNTQVQFADELTSYAEAAQLIIGSLARGEVTSFELVQVGKALSDSGNDALALRYFHRALAAQSATPDTRAAALRNEAYVRAQLGEIGRAHDEDMQAVRVFTGFPEETRSFEANNLALTYNDDAADELAARNCQLAHADLHNVRLLFGRGHLAPRRVEETSDSSMTSADQASYEKVCIRQRRAHSSASGS
jgi:hypothetical protein